MPGIFGYFGDPPSQGGETFLNAMAKSLNLDGDLQVSTTCQDNAGLGRVSLGVVNTGQQPLWDDTRQVCVVFDGELYDQGRLYNSLKARGHNLVSHDDAELILHLYLATGDLFPSQLNGVFSAAILDLRIHKLVLINDRLGLQPLYYARVGSRFLFSSKVSTMFVDPDLPRSVDRVAIAELLTFDHLLDDRTLLNSVKMMPQGCVMSVSREDVSFTPYSSLRYPKEYELRSEAEYIDELNSLLKMAVHRQAQDDLPKAVLLSGGMDSRVIAALLQQENGTWPYHTFTWGIPGCDDAKYAKIIAAKTRAEHHFFPLKPEYMQTLADRGVNLTDGMGNVVNLHALATLDDEIKYSKVIFKGFLGDAMFGFALRQQHWAEYNLDTSMKAHMKVHEDQGVITFHPNDHKNIFTREFMGEVGTAVTDSYRAGMLASDSRMLADQRLYFDLTQRVPRMTLRGVDVVRSKAHVRLPFADNDLLNFAIKLPPGLRHNRILMQHAFLQAFPDMARIPISWTGLPMQENLLELQMRARRLLQWHLHRLGLAKQSHLYWKPYHNYPEWFRGVLRPWIESVLLNEQALNRGYVKPEVLRSLVTRHMGGENLTVHLGALLSVELWHRQFID